jgi:hypothetical protein
MSTYDDASLVLVPSGYKNGVVFSQKPMDANGQLTFTRASSATRVGPDGYIEKVRENLQLYSEDFSNGAYVKQNVTLTAAQSDPLGGTGATSFKETTANDLHRFYYAFFAPSVSGYYTNSVYVKDDGRGAVLFGANSVGESFVFTFATATISNVTGTPFAYSATDAGNGWYRLSITFFAAAAFNFSFVQGWNGSTSSYAGDTSKGFFAFGSQLELSDFGPTPYIKTEAAAVSVGPVSGTPRLDYLNGECPSLLLEPQRTNVFPNSENTSNWSITNMTRTLNAGTSPDGYASADQLEATTTGVVSFTSDTAAITLTSGQPFICSFFIKLGTSFTSNVGQDILQLRLTNSGAWTRPTINLNLSTGAVTNAINASYLSSTNYGNGWFRITFGAIPTTTTSNVQLQVPTGTTMTAGGSFYIWGLQGENNASYATSYIPTLGTSVTRVADAAFKTGISSLIGQAEGTLYWEGYVTPCGDWNSLSSVEVKSVRFINLRLDTNNRIELGTANLSTDFNITSSTPAVAGTYYKIAGAYKSGQSVLYVNGVQIGTSATTFTTPTFSEFRFNVWDVFDQQKSIAQALLFKTRLTNAQLAELTTL